MLASPDIDFGAALRAKSISASRSGMRYCSIEAMRGYAAGRPSSGLRWVSKNLNPTAMQTIARATPQIQPLVLAGYLNRDEVIFAVRGLWRRSSSAALSSEDMPNSGD